MEAEAEDANDESQDASLDVRFDDSEGVFVSRCARDTPTLHSEGFSCNIALDMLV
jgi:hypothetical protein